MKDQPKGPRLTVDVIIHVGDSFQNVVLVKRKFPPLGWAIPGGFVDWGESAEAAAVREAREETSLDVQLLEQFRVYSDPQRDPRGPTASVVFSGQAVGVPQGGDDAARAEVFRRDNLPEPLVFDHAQILADYFNQRGGNVSPSKSRAPRPKKAFTKLQIIHLQKVIHAPASKCFNAFVTQRALRRWYDPKSKLACFQVGAALKADYFPNYQILLSVKNHLLVQQYTSVVDGVGLWTFVSRGMKKMVLFDHLAQENRGTEFHARAFHWGGLLENLAAYCEGRALPFVDAEYPGKRTKGIVASTCAQYVSAMRRRRVTNAPSS